MPCSITPQATLQVGLGQAHQAHLLASGSLQGSGLSTFSLSFSQDEVNSSPPLPGALSPHYGIPENNSPLGGKAGPLTKEKPKRNGGRGLEDMRPSVESLLDELESSVPSPV